MKTSVTLIVLIAATPAVAHNEVVVAASALPLAAGLATITLAGLAAWRNRFKTDKGQDSNKPERSNEKLKPDLNR